ncbi:3-oxoacyl-[acyl-carrier-protein] synthase III [Ligilactobacillus hayakitensis DSM 18933 = JCM 14209]|uniref:Beta-ketoacyl-[acyl-carrier-protein] synthase III n=1 Tax=Ligilactobacillus hayakitensis DSM 18933 = JCM 14209 TaxID=1423755 RepID=A0A0R1WNP8_9LACO|nr:beta-ketoacyl-ACP synthase III [Ligilactobacillus hayakitensis]KRM19394.1 3-oxoacyl-[acyl-carrier-protein] synthase III [Ligilactobacillus hayakitensis DSM 18933 = JCM 14209]
MQNLKMMYTSHYAPDLVIKNDDLAQIMDTSDEWITQRTGIKQRHISLKENTSLLATRVAKQLLEKSGWDVESLDIIVVATMSPDAYTPATGAIVQGNIGATNAIAFDISAACSGYIYALSIVESMMKNLNFKRGLIIGSENLSKILDWKDRSTAVLFGDGAGGTLVELSDQEDSKILSSDLKTIGSKSEYLTAGETKTLETFPTNVPHNFKAFQMEGREVYSFATREVPKSILRAVKAAKIDLEEVDYFLLHQANARIIKQVAKKLKLDEDKFPINIDEYGNTSAASEPILFDELVQSGRIKRGMTIAISGFGGGLTVGTHIIRY